jgi:transcriptional regulator with XRE-family HTH domain
MLKIKDLREEKGLTQKELAQRIHSTNKNIWAYENGIASPSIDVLIRIARLFEVTVDYLVGNSDELGNVGTTEQFTEEEIDLVRCYRAIGKAERLALITTAKSFYSQIKEKSGSHAT